MKTVNLHLDQFEKAIEISSHKYVSDPLDAFTYYINSHNPTYLTPILLESSWLIIYFQCVTSNLSFQMVGLYIYLLGKSI